MQNHLQLLQSYRKEMQEAEQRRDILSKQLAMVREAETLGTAMGSHQLNTLSQRYNVYKRTKNEFTATKLAILEKSAICNESIESFKDCMQMVHSELLQNYVHSLDEASAAIASISEFEIVKELLENSAQGAVYQQSEQIRKELESSYMQQTTITKQIFEAIQQYSDVVRFHPRSYIEQHRLYKYAEWSKFLSDNQSVCACREVVTQFQATLGENMIRPPLQPFIAFSCQLHAVMCEDNFKLKKKCELLQMKGESVNLVQLENIYVDGKSMISQFLQEQKGAVRALECVTLTAMCDLNKRLLMMENAAASSGDNLMDLTSNGKWFLDELFVITSILSEMTNIISENDSFGVDFVASVHCLRASNNIYGSLRDMHNTFIRTIITNSLHGIISEDTSVLEMISAVSSLQEGIQPIQELLSNLHMHLRCTVMNMPSQHQAASMDAKKLREKLNTLRIGFEKQRSDGMSTSGIDLFLLFNGLFEALDTKHQEMITAIQALDIPGDWRKIDQIKDARDLAVRFVYIFI